MATQKKIDTVSKLTEKIQTAKSIVFTDYAGLKHKQLEELRRSVKKEKGEFVVTKNTLMERALGETGNNVKPLLKNVTGTLFSYADEVTPLKVLKKFFKTANIGAIKGGLLGTTVLTDKETVHMAELPGKEVLLGRLVGQLNAPIQGFHYALSWNINAFVRTLNAIKEKKS